MMETYLYSLLSSGLGILIVFTALVTLSVMMVLLKRVFGASRRPVAVVEPPVSTGPAEVGADEEAGWLTAAIGAYVLAEEEAERAPSAADWGPGREERTDAWVSRPELRTRV